MQFQLYCIVLLGGCGLLQVTGQVATLCRPNESFLSCGGCQKSCENPTPACAAICRIGCYCPDDQVRGRDGICMPLSECPIDGHQYHDDTSGPRDILCPADEEYRLCEPCGNRTCENPNPICPAQCARGCFCKNGLVRDASGNCVELSACSDRDNYVKREICGRNQEFKECSNCESTCGNPTPLCPAQCERGCFCKDGFVKSLSGECIKLEDCPKEGLCEDPNTEYSCRSYCEEFCSGRPCGVQVSRCAMGCFCKTGLVRDDSSGLCVERERCTTPYNSNLIFKISHSDNI